MSISTNFTLSIQVPVDPLEQVTSDIPNLGKFIAEGQSGYLFVNADESEVYKIFPCEYMDIADHEASILRSVQEVSHSVIFHGEIKTEKYTILRLEYLKGHNLYDKFTRTALSVDTSIKILHQGLQFLDDLHTKTDIVHNDIKPENLHFQDGNLTVYDFGTSVKNQTQTSTGSIYYQSPEALQGLPRTFKDDVWSLAKTIMSLYLRKQIDNKVLLQQRNKVIRVFQRQVIRQGDDRNKARQLLSLLYRMLVENPIDRISTKEALEHDVFLAPVENRDSSPEKKGKKRKIVCEDIPVPSKKNKTN